MRISDWSSDVCSSDLFDGQQAVVHDGGFRELDGDRLGRHLVLHADSLEKLRQLLIERAARGEIDGDPEIEALAAPTLPLLDGVAEHLLGHRIDHAAARSEEHTSELQSLMRISYAAF